MTGSVVDPRVPLLVDAFRRLQDDEGIPSDRDAALVAVEVLDRFDEERGVLRMPPAMLRVVEQDRDRARGALFAAVQAFEAYQGPVFVDASSGSVCAPSIPIPTSMVEGWRIIAEGAS